MVVPPTSDTEHTFAKGVLTILGSKPTRFIMVGGVMSLCGLALNIFMVEGMQLSRQPAYGIVMVFLIFLGFMANRYITFDKGDTGLFTLFLQYASAVFVFRLADWLLYALLVEIFSVDYPLAQLGSGLIIMALKYFCYKKLFEGISSFTQNP